MKGKDTMKRAIWMLAVLLGLCPLLSAAKTGKSPAILLQEALYQEETEGDLDKAIDLYGQVLDQAADVERLAARATYQLGLCHLKKGDEPAAAEYFRKAVNTYPKQTSVAKKAQAELDKIKPGDPLQERPFIVWFKAKDSSPINESKQLLDAFNEKHPKGVMTFRYRTEGDNGQLIGRICISDGAGKDKIVKMLESHNKLELVKIQPAYTIVFRPSGTEQMDNSSLLGIFNENLPKDVNTYRYHTLTKNGNIEGSISTDTLAEKDKLVEMIQVNNRLKLVQVLGGESQGGLYDQATQAVWSTIGSLYGQTCAKAGAKNLYTNSNIHFVNSDFVHWIGGYGFYINESAEPISGRVRLSGTTNPHQKYYDIMGNLLDTEIVPDERPGREKYYNIYLNLSQSLAPGQFYPYGWATEGSYKLSAVPFNNDKCLLRMQNHFGSYAFEVFYLVVPNNLNVEYKPETVQVPKKDGSLVTIERDKPTITTVGNYTVYAWEKEVQSNENHVVTVYLSKNSGSGNQVVFKDSFEEGDDAPTGWEKGQNVDGVQYLWDRKHGSDGTSSLCLKKDVEKYFPIAQWTRSIDYTGEAKELSVSANVLAKKAYKAVIDALFLDDKGEWIKHEWVSYIGAKEAGDPAANHPWKKYASTVDIPENTKTIVIGLQMYGPGTVWFDEVEVSYGLPAQLDVKKLVEDFFKHNYRDITHRETLEWGEPVTEENGNISVRYKYEATIWDKDKIINDQVFTFDKDGKFISVRKVGAEDIYSLAGVQALVEDFFANNYRDITKRKTIEWGQPIKHENGDVSIRYVYEATIRDKNTITQNKVWTFDKNGKFVSVVDAEPDLSTPEATIKSFVNAVYNGNLETAKKCVSKDGHDYDEFMEMLATESNHPFQAMIKAMDVNIPIEITSKNIEDGKCKISWYFTLGRVYYFGDTKMEKGMHQKFSSYLELISDKWLIRDI